MAILLVTADKDVEERCRRAVSAQHSLVVFRTLAELKPRLSARKPDVVLIDAEVMTRPYEDRVAPIVRTPGASRVIVMTAEFVEDEEVALLRCGVQGCCRRGIDPDSLRQVLMVTESGVWVTGSLLSRLVTELRRYAQPPVDEADARAAAVPPSAGTRLPVEKLVALTPRERDIVKLIAGGASNKKVAEELDISERTVKGHLSNVFMKLGVEDRLKLVLYVNGGS